MPKVPARASYSSRFVNWIRGAADVVKKPGKHRLHLMEQDERSAARAAARLAGRVKLPQTRQTRRRLIFEATFRELHERHGPEGRRRLRAMARALGHKRYRELVAARAAEIATMERRSNA